MELVHILGEVVSVAGKSQLRIAETEKYAHVTYFFNGGIERPFPGEDRKLVPSPKVATYDLQPEMSGRQVTDEVLARMANYDLIILNFANPDMVGHTGLLDAGIKAVETVDECIGRIVSKLLELDGKCRCATRTAHPTRRIPNILCIVSTSPKTRGSFVSATESSPMSHQHSYFCSDCRSQRK